MQLLYYKAQNIHWLGRVQMYYCANSVHSVCNKVAILIQPVVLQAKKKLKRQSNNKLPETTKTTDAHADAFLCEEVKRYTKPTQSLKEYKDINCCS